MPAHKKARKLNDLTSVFIESFFIEHPDWIRYVPPVDGPLKKWLMEEVKLAMSASWTSALGNGSGGDFADLKIVPTKGDN
jgi:hypothetical protein